MMKSALIASLFAVTLAGAAPVEAKGCLKGAAVGGVGGHFVGKGHAVLGAVAGCAIGHHRAKVATKKAAAKSKPQ
ncbi:hypothetical protein ASE75_01240 [Sphingomonas sp. Leaf17]|uniref:hypothetical protein n=1 Tax=Sphingomonas sp. Leaf17 TaxID=1735683 RepID=UPI000700D2CE|nr:hypothetical protein [Sphingomonas sp. Leaf17]KQM67590.1 hypothetical protein ASE75_01240 [Sphingomonas sp. Leaf17]